MCVVLCVSLRDMSGATWGGSSSEEEEEEGVSSVTGLNDTRDDHSLLTGPGQFQDCATEPRA